MSADAILARLEQLEAVSAIQALKARYLTACDSKDCESFRACFLDGKVAIDYGPVGQFDNADALTAVFREFGCQAHMLEWHHASNPQIELLTPERARGSWSLHYQLINTQDQTLTQLGGEYGDEYRRTEAGWKISATLFVPRTRLFLKLDSEAVQTLAAGQPPAEAL